MIEGEGEEDRGGRGETNLGVAEKRVGLPAGRSWCRTGR